ncbi:MAG: alcohol dehydrogenase catalytic domain-containing protein [Deltaproteobacteria bacterium]|nr:alcohol dehydrogenase catalytic domain-containing protein [Deltaproteobacteria bacterium]
MPDSMRVAMYYTNKDIRIERLPVPRVGDGELLLKIRSSGVCGSDVMEWYRRHKAPLVLGHEVAGEVVEAGRGVERFAAGDRVVVSHHVPCMTCHHCMMGHETACDTLRSTNFDPGGFGEYVRIPAINVRTGTYRIPENVSNDEATFAEPVACVLRGQRRANLKPGCSVLVIGSGISGILHIAAAAAQGAGTIVATDLSSHRLDLARRFGAGYAFSARDYAPDRLRDVNDGRLADVVITTASARSALEQALASVERGGTVLFFAPTGPDETIPLSINDVFWRNDVTLTTSYAGAPAEHVTALNMIAAGRLSVKEMITHRFDLDGTQDAFALVASGGESLKVIVHPHGD